MPSQRVVKFGDGALELTQGSIKLNLILSSEVEVTHTTFLVMKACHTPLILGMDFLKLTGCRPDAAQGCLEFTGKNGSKFVVDTFDGDGMLPEGAVVPEDLEALIIPVLLKQNTWNPKIQDVKLNEAMDFGPGETTMFPLKIAKDAASWTYNRALQQPDAALWGRGLYVMPMVLHGGKVFDDATHSIAIMNTAAKEAIPLERGTRLGTLYNASSIPDEVELLDSFDDVMEHLMVIYHHAD